ncbi:hypothetical protein Pst134EA_032140 [Puccinia striiformis f. sp. tritici]|uniref:uncharacterized protein n=1 Tax=Puccinia striiformis f. sp. tritici TaxID=168172 RepID=UPI002007F1A5|nr:uncharacterized protein Pst134EA_032140 [Puccinia striiformis f. sp. tritici]KAH9441880.1 hypothetical protein Pst134EA_032140 [Puccinia striiformis f. sp. tritici]
MYGLDWWNRANIWAQIEHVYVKYYGSPFGAKIAPIAPSQAITPTHIQKSTLLCNVNLLARFFDAYPERAEEGQVFLSVESGLNLDGLGGEKKMDFFEVCLSPHLTRSRLGRLDR